MPVDDAPPRRRYHQTRRAELTALTRSRIRAAAHTLFLVQGYAGTSMRAVAEHAGVGPRTVYDNYPTKSELLKDVVQVAIVGDALQIPARARGWFEAILDEVDPIRRARLLAAASTQLHRRTAPIFAVARSAASNDAEVAQLWRDGKAGHHSDCEALARAAVTSGGTRAVRTMTTSLYVLIGPETYTLLTDELGFTPRAYQRWLSDQLTALFERASHS
jgi:AcrR family transcriptional regulator